MLEKQGYLKKQPFAVAISRAYYSAFRHALNCAKDSGDYREPDSPSLNHREIRRYYQRNKKVHVSTQLGRLHELRIEADYDDAGYRINKKAVDIAIKLAQEVLTLK